MKQLKLKPFLSLVLSVLIVGVLISFGDLGAAAVGGTSIALMTPSFTNIEDLKAFTKAWQANSEGNTDVAALTNGAGTTYHNLDDTMILLANSMHDFKFINTMFNKDTRSTLNIFARILDWGGNGDPSFVGEADDVEFKDVNIDRITANVSFMAEGYAISKVLEMSNTGSFNPEQIQVQGAIMRIMRTLAYTTWYGNKSINSLEFPGFVKELIDAGQVYDAQGGFPAISDIKEMTVEIRQNWGLVNDFWLHPAAKAVLDNYYVGAKEFVVHPNTTNPDIGYDIPGLRGADLKDNRLQFKTDMWLNRHQVKLPTYRNANGVYVEGKTNDKSPDAPSAVAAVSGLIAGSKWKANDCKNSAGVDAEVSYHIVACNRWGRSAKSTVVTSDLPINAGKSVNLTITPAGTGITADYFEIFRESFPGSGKFYLTERIVKSNNPTTVHADLNEWRPGCTEGVVGDFNSQSATDETRTYQFIRMLPLLQTKFGRDNALYQRKIAGMVELYGTLAVLQPKRFYVVKNLPTANVG